MIFYVSIERKNKNGRRFQLQNAKQKKTVSQMKLNRPQNQSQCSFRAFKIAQLGTTNHIIICHSLFLIPPLPIFFFDQKMLFSTLSFSIV